MARRRPAAARARAARRPYRSFASTTIERPSGVSSASDASCAASASCRSVRPASGMNSDAWRLPSVIVPVLSSSSVCTSPAASTARPDIASTLCCTSRSMPAMPMADSKPPIVVGIRQTSSDDQHEQRLWRPGIDRQRLQGDDGDEEDDRQPGQQNVERDLVRRLLPRGALDERNHPVEERLARVGGDAHLDPVREHARAARDRRAIAARLTNDRCRLAGDGRFVHRRDPFDDLAVAGNDFACRHQDDVARAARRVAGTRSTASP